MVIYTAIDDDTQSFYNKTLLVRAVPNLLHDKFGQQKPIPTNSTRKQTFRRFNAFAINTTPLVEGVTPLGKDLTKTDVTCTLSQFGDFTTVSDVATWVSRDKVLTEAAEVLGEQAGQSVDAVWRDILVAGTNVFCAEDSAGATGTTRTNVDGLINGVFLDKLIRQLKGQNAKFHQKMIKASTGVGTVPIRAAFFAITHPDVEFTLEGVSGFKATSEYGNNAPVMEPYEIGAYKNLRFCSTTQAKIFPGAGGGPTAGNKQSAGKDDVYVTLVFGTNAYGIVPLNGHSLENIVQPLGSAGTADPLKQRATSGWKAMTTAVILNDAFMVRGETAAAA
jgi:N4-gp56 family major capsid protein